jgi:AraC-like DNA-binding protein
VFTSATVAFWFTVVYDIFYIFFAIRFVDYAARFHVIEEAMESDPEEDTVPEEPVLPDDHPAITATGGKTAAHFAELDRHIEEWVADKGYTEKSVTAKMLVPRFYTNDRYLSAYINTCKKKSFSRWVNELRVEEAQRLMAEHPEMPLPEIASRAGFGTQSHFSQQFRAITGHSPSNLRKQTKNQSVSTKSIINAV